MMFSPGSRLNDNEVEELREPLAELLSDPDFEGLWEMEELSDSEGLSPVSS